MNSEDVVRYYKTLNYDQQRVLIAQLLASSKSPSYSIVFELNTIGLKRMARCVRYCSKYNIPYKTSSTKDKRKVKFTFRDLSRRNKVLIGYMTLDDE